MISFLASCEMLVMATPWIPHGVMCLNPASDSWVMLIPNPCMETHFFTPTPMDASFLLPTQTPVRPFFVDAFTLNSRQVSMRACSMAWMNLWRSLPLFLRSMMR